MLQASGHRAACRRVRCAGVRRGEAAVEPPPGTDSPHPAGRTRRCACPKASSISRGVGFNRMARQGACTCIGRPRGQGWCMFHVDDRRSGHATAVTASGTRPETLPRMAVVLYIGSFAMYWLAISQCWQASCNDNLHLDASMLRASSPLRPRAIRGAFFWPARRNDAAEHPVNLVPRAASGEAAVIFLRFGQGGR